MTKNVNWISVTKGIDERFLGMYEVCDLGLIRRTKDGTICKNVVCSYNYTYTEFICNRFRKRYQTQRIVALHFIPNPNNYSDIIKRFDDRKNNAAVNLMWCSRGQSIASYRKEKHKIVQMDRNGNYINEYDSLKLAEAESGAKAQAISNCISGTGTHLPKTAGGFTWKKIIYCND